MIFQLNKLSLTRTVLNLGKHIPLRTIKNSLSIRNNSSLSEYPRWQILTGNPSSSSIVLQVDPNQIYLFNCGESASKMLKYYGYKFHIRTKQAVFITSPQWKNIGGIPGICLAMSKTNRNRHLDVHGSDIVTHIHQITGNNLLDKSAFRLITPKNLKHNDDFIEVTKIKLPREKHKERPKFNISLDQEAAARTVIKNALKVPYYNNNEVFAYVVHIKSSKQRVLVCEIPEVEHLSSLINLLPSILGKIETVFHLSHPDIIQHETYRNWLELWPKGVQHITANSRSNGYSLPINEYYYGRLRYINKEIFPKLTESFSGLTATTLSKNVKLLHCLSCHKIEGNPGTLKEAESKYKSINSDMIKEKLTNQTYPVIQFLGTGSGESNLHRNCPCILIQKSKNSYIMLDCGEGSLAQLATLKGDQTDRVLCNLQMIFISHQHSDHHLGLNNILLARQEALKRRTQKTKQLFIVCTGFYGYILARYHTLVEPVAEDVVCVYARNLCDYAELKEDRIKDLNLDDTLEDDAARIEREKNLDALLKQVGIQSIQTCKADHSKDSFSITFTLKPSNRNEDGYKITYSGDTRPNDKLIKIGTGSDVLIHEATFSNCALDQAIVHKHSTLSEAILVGKRMKAKYTLLTHFPSIFQQVPQLTDLRNLNSVGLAFDFLTVNPSNIKSCSNTIIFLENEFRDVLLDIESNLKTVRKAGPKSGFKLSCDEE